MRQSTPPPAWFLLRKKAARGRWSFLSARSFLASTACLILALLTWHVTHLATPTIQAVEPCTCPNTDDELACNKAKQQCLQDKIAQKQQESSTLANAIELLDNQIELQMVTIRRTQLEIAALKKQIAALGEQIVGLNSSLDALTDQLVEEVDLAYQRRTTSPFVQLLTTPSLDSFVRKQQYASYAQAHLVDLMLQAETARTDYETQKTTKEKAQADLAKKESDLLKQQKQLDGQKKEKQVLLTQTKNDEAVYQQELAKTLAELKAIEGITSGYGSETKIRDVKEGETIASIIQGASTCSTGTHLHFEVVKDGTRRDPSGFLKPVDIAWSNSPDGPFSFGGSWNWPVNNAARISQGYGMTWYARVRRSYGGQPHTGIDMNGKSSGDTTLKAVKDGTLFRGSIACGKGQLRYVKVEHKDEKVSSYYLHVNY